MESVAESQAPLTGWAALEALASSGLPPKDFWSRFAAVLREITGAAVVLGVHRTGPDQPWRVIASSVDGPQARRLNGEELVKSAPDLASAASGGENFPRRLISGDGKEALVAATPVTSRRAGEQAIVLAFCATTVSEEAVDAQVRAAALVPATYEARLAIERAESESRNLTNVLDVVAVTNAEERFGAAAMGFCNAVASQYECDRVSVGWLTAGYSRLAAVSRHEHVNRKLETPQRIESAMDECLDQDESIHFPPPPEATFVSHDHQKLAGENSGTCILTVPLHQDGKPVAALLCERGGRSFSAAESTAIRLAVAQAAPRLSALRTRDRWFGARFAAWLRERAGGMLGPRHTLAKLFAIFLAALLAVLIFWRTEYRVEGNFILRSDKVSNLTSPIEGYIKEVLAEPGQQVKAGQVLLRLNTDALKVEETAAVAELERYTREEEKARAANTVAEMQIAASLARQAAAKLEIVRFRLAQSEIKSSMDGVILEGDLKEHLDAPVKQGDPLFRIARLSGFSMDIQLDERDAQEVANGAAGECSFLSRPEETLPLKVDLVLPSAVEKEGVNLFAARARIQAAEASWWRPGLSGVAKINAGERSLLWIISHRTVDFLRLKLWW
jgi:hypothetical protein